MSNEETDFGQMSATPNQAGNEAQGAGASSITNKDAINNKDAWLRAGVGAGVVLGGVGAAVAHAIPNEEHDVQTAEAADEQSAANGQAAANGQTATTAAAATASHPVWADESIQVATGVNDDMSFDEAFAAARAEVGAGGAFEWHGKVYGTYYATEWDSMSAAEKHDYESHFAWGEASAHTESHHTAAHEHKTESHTAEAHHTPTDTNAPTDAEADQSTLTPTIDTDDDDKIQVIGVVHDSESNMNVAATVVSGQEVMLFDVDNDLTFDVAVSDQNHDGQIQEDEVVDISQAHITVDDCGGFTNPTASGSDDNLLASNGGPDYVNDADDILDI